MSSFYNEMDEEEKERKGENFKNRFKKLLYTYTYILANEIKY